MFQLLSTMTKIKRISSVQEHSSSKKYHLIMRDGQELLLEICRGDVLTAFEERRKIAQAFRNNSISTNQCIQAGKLFNGRLSYQCLSWLPGEDLRNVLLSVPIETQKELGIMAGKLLRKIHGVSSLHYQFPIRALKDRIYGCLSKRSFFERFPESVYFLEFIHGQKDEVSNRSETALLHGDFHAKNLIWNNKSISIIDWTYSLYGDPWEDFVRNIVSAEISPVFAASIINAYFFDSVPSAFWQYLKLYSAIQQLELCELFCWNKQFVSQQHNMVLKQYDWMKNDIPFYYHSL